MSKSNFSKAMKELIGINDNEEEKEDEEFGEQRNPLSQSAFFQGDEKEVKAERSSQEPPKTLAEQSFDKERDDAAAKLRMMLNKDKETEKKDAPASSLAEKFAKATPKETAFQAVKAEEEKIKMEIDFGQAKETQMPVEPLKPAAAQTMSKPVIKDISPEDARTVIGKGVTITGGLSAQGDIEIKGIVKGDVKTTGNVTVVGKIAGDIGATDLSLVSGGAVQGDVMARGTASIAKDSVIIGDVTAGNINLNGKVKGNLAARDVADLSDTSVIDGNITAASVAINPGTKLRGQISLTSASDVNDDDFLIDFDA